MKRTQEELVAIIAAQDKIKSIDTLEVTTAAGNTFDAYPKARQDMSDGIIASETTGQTTTTWRLADNTEVVVGIAELREAHLLSIQAYALAKSIG